MVRQILTNNQGYGVLPSVLESTIVPGNSGEIITPTYILTGTYTSQTSISIAYWDGAETTSPMFNQNSPLLQGDYVTVARSFVSGDVFVFVKDWAASSAQMIRVYKLNLDDIRSGLFNPRYTHVFSFSLGMEVAGTKIENAKFSIKNIAALSDGNVFFVPGTSQYGDPATCTHCLVDLNLKRVWRIKGYSYTDTSAYPWPVSLSEFSNPCLLVNGPSMGIVFYDLSQWDSAGVDIPNTTEVPAHQYAPYSDGFVRITAEAPSVQTVRSEKYYDGALSGYEYLTGIMRKEYISYGGSYSTELVDAPCSDENTVSYNGHTYKVVNKKYNVPRTVGSGTMTIVGAPFGTGDTNYLNMKLYQIIITHDTYGAAGNLTQTSDLVTQSIPVWELDASPDPGQIILQSNWIDDNRGTSEYVITGTTYGVCGLPPTYADGGSRKFSLANQYNLIEMKHEFYGAYKIDELGQFHFRSITLIPR